MSKPIKRSVAVVIRREGGGEGEFLTVRRPPDDEDLPDVWGLPAATLKSGETWFDAAGRIGREKLGVRLRPTASLREGVVEREGYVLRLRLCAAKLDDGEPEVPQPHGDVTQYVAWSWSGLDALAEGARLGSLCCRLMWEHAEAGGEWSEAQG